MKTKTASITLEVKADIELNGLPLADLECHLRTALSRAIESGLLTGDTEAEVDEYSATVTLNRNAKWEGEITEFLQALIEDGALDAEGMARRIARYGLMLPSDFVAEMEERADQADG